VYFNLQKFKLLFLGRYIGSVLDKMPKKFAITMKREIAELIAKYEQKVAEEENE